MEQYLLRMMFDCGAQTCLWSMNDSAIEEFGDYGVDIDHLPVSDELRTTLLHLCAERDTALDWEYPANDLLWSEEEQERFREKAKAAYDRLRTELGEDYRVVYREEWVLPREILADKGGGKHANQRIPEAGNDDIESRS